MSRPGCALPGPAGSSRGYSPAATDAMTPAINVALAASGNPLAFAMLVALSASNNFLSQSNPVLSMITGPAGYRPRDLWRTGAPLTVCYLAITLVAVNLMF